MWQKVRKVRDWERAARREAEVWATVSKISLANTTILIEHSGITVYSPRF